MHSFSAFCFFGNRQKAASSLIARDFAIKKREPLKFAFLILSVRSAAHWRSRASRAAGHRRTLLAKTSAVALTGVCRFKLCLLAGRDKVSVLFEILDDLFADHLTLKASKCRFDRFVIVNRNKSHLSFTSFRPRFCSREQSIIR